VKKAVSTQDAPQAIGPYSQGVSAGGLVFVSGQIPLTPAGEPVTGGVKEQTERCLLNIAGVLKAAGAGMSEVVKTTVFMTDLGQFAAMNEVYAKHFSAPFPARATVEVSKLPKGVQVEIEAVAALLR
jgi:2-iminobutanoate/2-iminopropanoate deaminase